MGKWLIVAVAVVVVAGVAFQFAGQAQAEDPLVVRAPAANPAPTAPGQPVKWGERSGAYVPAVPTPPGVLGAYAQLPCSVPGGGMMAGGSKLMDASERLQYLVRELGERQ